MGGEITPYQSTAPPDNSKGTLHMLDNGLVDVSKIPPYLKKVVEDNGRNSPLLRLPPELRYMIWEYTFSGDEVTFIPARVYERMTTRMAISLPSVFRLPETCRQVYAEIATLAYTHSTFIFQPSEYMWGHKRFSRKLTRAARESIKVIEIGTRDLDKEEWENIRDTFPNLAQVVLGHTSWSWWEISNMVGWPVDHDDLECRQAIETFLRRPDGDSDLVFVYRGLDLS